MTTLIVVVAVLIVGIAAATWINRRSPDAPTAPAFAVPQQLDRHDFASPASPWLLVLFSSATCLSCRDARAALDSATSPFVAVQDVTYERQRALHDKYRIDAVPTVALADSEGVVRWSYMGPPPPDAVADLLEDIGAHPPDDGTPVDLG